MHNQHLLLSQFETATSPKSDPICTFSQSGLCQAGYNVEAWHDKGKLPLSQWTPLLNQKEGIEEKQPEPLQSMLEKLEEHKFRLSWGTEKR